MYQPIVIAVGVQNPKKIFHQIVVKFPSLTVHYNSITSTKCEKNMVFYNINKNLW